MNKKKEDALRKKAQSNLDPKGWEALLEGIPRVDDEAQPEGAGEKNPETPAPSDQRVLRVTDESGTVSERDISRERTPALPPKDAQPAPDRNRPEAKAAAEVSGEHTLRPVSVPETKEEGERQTRLGRAADRLKRHPLVQRLVQYYLGLSPREQRIVAAGLLFVSVMLVYSIVLNPMFESNALLNRKIEKKEQELSEMMRLRSSIDQDRGGMEQIKRIIEQRPPGFSVFAYLEQIAAKAEMKDKIIYIKPQRETPVGPFRESLAEIKLDRIELEALTRFLYRIESSEDLLYIKNLKIKAGRFGKDEQGLEVILSVGTLLKRRTQL